ncbi:MAG: hypothetical protein R2825_16800 [Saprospiraceae bacterium]
MKKSANVQTLEIVDFKNRKVKNPEKIKGGSEIIIHDTGVI